MSVLVSAWMAHGIETIPLGAFSSDPWRPPNIYVKPEDEKTKQTRTKIRLLKCLSSLLLFEKKP